MGSDIYIAIGRIKNKQLAAPTDGSVAQDSAVVVFDNKNIPPSDIEAFAYEDIYPDPDWVGEEKGHPDFVKLGRDTSLFAWLAGREGYLRPAIDPKVLQQKSSEFMEWLYKDKRLQRGNISFLDDLELYGNGCFFYPVSVLLAFDYDQVAVMGDNVRPGQTFYYKPGVSTYREIFHDEWFKFLDLLKRDGWDFIVISID